MTYSLEKSVKHSAEIRATNGSLMYIQFESVVSSSIGTLAISVRSAYNNTTKESITLTLNKESLVDMVDVLQHCIKQKDIEDMERIL